MNFRPTLAVNAELDKIKYPVYASPKLDGIRASIVDGKALSRTLKDIPNHHIRTLLSRTEFNGFDGELIIGRPNAKDCYTQSVSGVMRHEGTPEFTYFVFDDFSHPNATYQYRLDQLVSDYRLWPKYIQLLPQQVVNNEAEMLTFEAECVVFGYEGIILRAMDAPYKFGRSTVKEGYLLKCKRFSDAEAEIVGFDEEMFNGNEAETNELGRTKRSTARAGLSGKGTLGALRVRSPEGIEFSIGTGLTAAQRQDYWDRRDALLGQTVKYKYFAVGVKTAPRHPVFLGFRSSIDV